MIVNEILKTFIKQPSERLDYDILGEKWLYVGDGFVEVLSRVITRQDGNEYEEGTLKDEGTVIREDGKRVKIWLSGGVDGQSYLITLRILTKYDLEKEVDFYINVMESPMNQKFANLSRALLAQSVDTSDTQFSIKNAVEVPSLSAGEFFIATVFTIGSDYGTNIEIVKVVQVDGNLWTVERGQEDTTAKEHPQNSRIELRLTAGALADIHDELAKPKEWTAKTVTKAEAEATSGDERKAWTVTRVNEASQAWWDRSAMMDKLESIETDAKDDQLANEVPVVSTGNLKSTNVQSALEELQLDVDTINDDLETKVDKVVGQGLSDSNYTQAEKDKLAGLESSKFVGLFVSESALPATGSVGDYANVDGGAGNDVYRVIWDSTNSKWVAMLGTSSELTGAQIKQQYESNPDTNAFTNDEKVKLTGIAFEATKNQTDGYLLNRANHTGTQGMETIDGLADALNTKADIDTVYAEPMQTSYTIRSVNSTENQVHTFLLNGTNNSFGIHAYALRMTPLTADSYSLETTIQPGGYYGVKIPRVNGITIESTGQGNEPHKRMTRHQEHGQTITATTEYDATATLPIWKIFKAGDTTAVIDDAWAASRAPTPTDPQVITLMLPNAVKLGSYGMLNRYGSAYVIASPRTWTLEGRLGDEGSWNIIHTVTDDLGNNRSQRRDYNIPTVNQGMYDQYRWVITARNGDKPYMAIARMFLYTVPAKFMIKDGDIFYSVESAELTPISGITGPSGITTNGTDEQVTISQEAMETLSEPYIVTDEPFTVSFSIDHESVYEYANDTKIVLANSYIRFSPTVAGSYKFCYQEPTN